MAKIGSIDSIKKTFNWLLLKNLLKKFNTTSLLATEESIIGAIAEMACIGDTVMP